MSMFVWMRVCVCVCVNVRVYAPPPACGFLKLAPNMCLYLWKTFSQTELLYAARLILTRFNTCRWHDFVLDLKACQLLKWHSPYLLRVQCVMSKRSTIWSVGDEPCLWAATNINWTSKRLLQYYEFSSDRINLFWNLAASQTTWNVTICDECDVAHFWSISSPLPTYWVGQFCHCHPP